jgi:hypothetical protein
VIVIEDSESELDANNHDEGYSHDSKLSTQLYDGFSIADFSTEDKTEAKEDAISLELVDGPESQASRLPRCEPTLLTPPTGSSATEMGESTQGARGDTCDRSLGTGFQLSSQDAIYNLDEEKRKKSGSHLALFGFAYGPQGCEGKRQGKRMEARPQA